MINIEKPSKPIPPDTFALFFLGFRPFFSLAGLAAVLLMALWIPVYFGHIEINPYFDKVTWHGHEMLFGYAVAVISGFLLTAVRNWTSRSTPDGFWLAMLAGLWLAGRVVSTVNVGLPEWLIMAIDLSFIPSVVVALAPALIGARKLRNMVFLIVLLVFATANLLVHLQALGLADTGGLGIKLALGMVVLIILVLGGRVIPFFTRNPLPGMKLRQWKLIEIAAIGGYVLLVIIDSWGGTPQLAALLAYALCACHLIRLAGWYDRRIWGRPIIWILHLAYAWMVVGFLLKGLSLQGVLSQSLAVHAFTAGGIGLITLGMMSRVSLGHTSRPLELPRLTVVGFFLLVGAGLLRVVGVALFEGQYEMLIHASAGLWILAFTCFCFDYWPILWRPRVDGRRG